ncbi:MAG: acyltransferase family protein [Roseiarcus sp.]
MGLLRILLAISVFCAHSRALGNLRWLGGDLAVECFFVISGFYMQMVLSTKYSLRSLGQGWAYQFYKARYFRLAPAYLSCAALVACAAAIRQTRDLNHVWAYVYGLDDTLSNIAFKVYFLVTNVTMLFQDVVMFLVSHDGQIASTADRAGSDVVLWHGLLIPQAWSLGIELSFYILAPFLLNLRSRWVAAVAIAGVALKVAAISRFQLGDPWTFRFFPFELAFFLLGALAFRFRHVLARLAPEGMGRPGAYLLVIVFATARLPDLVPNIVYPLALSLLIPALFHATAKIEGDRFIGDLSYPFYIFHYFCLNMTGYALANLGGSARPDPVWLALLVAFSASFALLMLEARFVEPWRARFSEPRVRPDAPAIPDTRRAAGETAPAA